MQNFQETSTVDVEIAEVEALLCRYETMMQSPQLDCTASEAVEILQTMVSRLNALCRVRDGSGQLLRAD